SYIVTKLVPYSGLSYFSPKIYYEAAGITLNKQFARNLELLTEDGKYNYAAYLLADRNNLSIKVAKYNGMGRSELVESNEYGQESLIKATKQVLDKIEVANINITKITSRERENTRLWQPVALREAIINAFVHNDYSKEVPPKFEIFSDRIEITSAGGLPEGLSQAEFFEGFSVPRNKELMRVFRDLDLVEQLGSGVPRILDYYSRDCFSFCDNFLRMAFPSPEMDYSGDIPQVPPQVTPQVEQLMLLLDGEMSRKELQGKSGLSDRKSFVQNYMEPAMEGGLIEYTIPEKPNSRLQKYRLTEKGKAYKKSLLRTS
ncbi:MAG: ATP-binding protein, partial [Balneolaceae bacterium]